MRNILDRRRESATIRQSVMSKRKEANRAEAIVRGVGAIILLLLLGIMTQVLPQTLKGKDTHEMMSTMMQIIMGLTILSGLVLLC